MISHEPDGTRDRYAWVAFRISPGHRKCATPPMMIPVGLPKSMTRLTSGCPSTVSGSVRSARRGASPSTFPSSACECETATGSLSTMANRAQGMMALAASCTAGQAGSPAPRSRNCVMPPSRAALAVAAHRNSRLSRAHCAMPGLTWSIRSACSLSAAKLSFPPSR
jgi:hypothetical protein